MTAQTPRWSKTLLRLGRSIVATLAALGIASACGGAKAQSDPGAEAVEPSDRVVNGTPTTHDAWPSLVLIHMVNAEGQTFMCGGSVIAPGWVLTAGHCAKGFDARRMTVTEGVANQSQAGRKLKVSEAIVQPGYTDSPEPHDDVALLRLDGHAASPPQRLMSENGSRSVITDGATGYVAGFGLTKPQRSGAPHVGQVSKGLLQAKLPLVQPEACRSILERAVDDPGIDRILDASTICAGDVKGAGDSCSGDSGGPLSTRVVRNLKVQIGVISWGPGCAQPGTVGVYASVGHFEGWIREHVPEAVFYDGGIADPAHVAAGQRPEAQAQVPGAAAALDQEAQSLVPNQGLRVEVSEGRMVHVGDDIHVHVTSAIAGQLLVYNIDQGTGSVYQVYPNAYAADARRPLAAGSEMVVPGPRDDFAIEVQAPLGRNRLYAFVVPPGEGVNTVASRGMDMRSLPDAPGVLAELDRAVVVVPKPHGTTDRASATVDYEIRP